MLLVVDAAYAEYVARNDYSNGTELVDAHDNVVMMRTFSKIFALGGLRLGWAYCPPAVADVLNRVRGPFNVSAAAQAAGVAALEDLAFTDRAARTTTSGCRGSPSGSSDSASRCCRASAISCWSSFPRRVPRPPTAANAHLNQRGIIPRAVANYGLPNHIRITIGTEAELRAVVAALAGFMECRRA